MTSRTRTMLLTLIYIRVATLLVNNKRIILFNLIVLLSCKKQSTCFTLL